MTSNLTSLTHRSHWLAAILLSISASGHALDSTAPDTKVTVFDPDRIGWQRVQMGASRLFMSMDADLKLEVVDSGEIVPRLAKPGQGEPVLPGPTILNMSYLTEGLGRTSDYELLLDASDGRALQRTSLVTGNRTRHRVYRFTDLGVYHHTRWPVKGEEKQRHETWSDLGEGLRPYPAGLPDIPVTEPTGLIYLAAAAPLEAPGDRFEILTFARRYVHRVEVEMAEPERIKVNYRETNADGVTKREGTVNALRILIRGREAVDDEDDQDDFEMLGLTGDIELFLEPETRAPLQLSGKAKIFGQVTFRLNESTVR
jgi:hypothetical protein